MKPTLSLLTVMGNDRAGIIAEVSRVLFGENCNLEDISMTVLEGQLAMMMVVCVKPEKRRAVHAALKNLGQTRGLTFFWNDFKETRTSSKPAGTYLVRAIGRDRTGIVYEVSQALAKSGLNITDLNSKILGKKSKPIYAMALEVEIPENFELKRLEQTFSRLRKRLKIELTLKPIERFEF